MRPRLVTLGAVAGSLVLLGGCGDRGTDGGLEGGSGDAVVEPEPDPVVLECPTELPFGSGEAAPAERPPDWPGIEAAVVCGYVPGQGQDAGWELQVGVGEVPRSAFAELDALLSDLEPAPADQVCTFDIGRRVLLLAATPEGTVGVVGEDFGCGNLLLTSDPQTEPAGEGSGSPAAGGAFDGGRSLVALLEPYAGQPTPTNLDPPDRLPPQPDPDGAPSASHEAPAP